MHHWSVFPILREMYGHRVDLLLLHTGYGYVIRQDARGHIENELAVSLGAGTDGSHPEYDGIGSSTVHERWHGGGAAESEARVYKDRMAALETLQRILGRAEPVLDVTPALLATGAGESSDDDEGTP